MKFQIEQILTIKDKAYLFCKGLDTAIFKLSDTCRLGKFEIENWFDIPIEPLETNGNERKDAFAFVLKKLDDREKISLGDVLELSSLSAKVIQSAYTVSGAIIT